MKWMRTFRREQYFAAREALRKSNSAGSSNASSIGLPSSVSDWVPLTTLWLRSTVFRPKRIWATELS